MRKPRRYLNAWKWLALWLQIKHCHFTKAVTYRNALDYIDWRTAHKKKTGKTVRGNMTKLEPGILAIIMGEAVRLGHLDTNPLVGLKPREERPAKKSEIREDEIEKLQERSPCGCRPRLE